MADIDVVLSGGSIVVVEMNQGVSGYSGRSGYSGFSGNNPGTSGYSGFSGRSGYSGYSGGQSGYSGFSGASGYSGFSGRSGYSGYSGTGTSGYSGFSGVSGYSGFSGVSGYSGFSGFSGYSGFSGGGVAWAPWTPSWANLTLGAGTVVAKYVQNGKTVVGRLSLVFAADTSISGDVSFTLPVTSVSYPGVAGVQVMGVGSLFDGATAYDGIVTWATTTTGRLLVKNASATYLSLTILSATIPFAWGTSDEIWLQFTYEAA